ncbi:hypothetical protein NKH77_28785 [Streptomyces sp. M19]
MSAKELSTGKGKGRERWSRFELAYPAADSSSESAGTRSVTRAGSGWAVRTVRCWSRTAGGGSGTTSCTCRAARCSTATAGGSGTCPTPRRCWSSSRRFRTRSPRTAPCSSSRRPRPATNRRRSASR